MVDREARDKMAELLRHFVARRITDAEFDWNLPHSETDDTAHKIADELEMSFERWWGKPKYLKPLNQEQRQELARIAVYLYTDLEEMGCACSIWPFCSPEEYEEALKHPKLLCGGRNLRPV